LQDTRLARIRTVPLARNEAGRQGSAEANGRSSLKAPKSVRAAEEFSRTRLSQSFFMRDFLFSEIAAIEGLSNLPDDPELAIAAGRGLCENLLEPCKRRSAASQFAPRIGLPRSMTSDAGIVSAALRTRKIEPAIPGIAEAKTAAWAR
jgi:hypothetical protein